MELARIIGVNIPCVFLSFYSHGYVFNIPDIITVSPVIVFPTIFYLNSTSITLGTLP